MRSLYGGPCSSPRAFATRIKPPSCTRLEAHSLLPNPHPPPPSHHQQMRHGLGKHRTPPRSSHPTESGWHCLHIDHVLRVTNTVKPVGRTTMPSTDGMAYGASGEMPPHRSRETLREATADNPPLPLNALSNTSRSLHHANQNIRLNYPENIHKSQAEQIGAAAVNRHLLQPLVRNNTTTSHSDAGRII